MSPRRSRRRRSTRPCTSTSRRRRSRSVTGSPAWLRRPSPSAGTVDAGRGEQRGRADRAGGDDDPRRPRRRRPSARRDAGRRGRRRARSGRPRRRPDDVDGGAAEVGVGGRHPPAVAAGQRRRLGVRRGGEQRPVDRAELVVGGAARAGPGPGRAPRRRRPSPTARYCAEVAGASATIPLTAPGAAEAAAADERRRGTAAPGRGQRVEEAGHAGAGRRGRAGLDQRDVVAGLGQPGRRRRSRPRRRRRRPSVTCAAVSTRAGRRGGRRRCSAAAASGPGRTSSSSVSEAFVVNSSKPPVDGVRRAMRSTALTTPPWQHTTIVRPGCRATTSRTRHADAVVQLGDASRRRGT